MILPVSVRDIPGRANLQRLLAQYKGESLGRYVRERKLPAARDLRDTDQKVYDICPGAHGFDLRGKTLRAFLPARSTCCQRLS